MWTLKDTFKPFSSQLFERGLNADAVWTAVTSAFHGWVRLSGVMGRKGIFEIESTTFKRLGEMYRGMPNCCWAGENVVSVCMFDINFGLQPLNLYLVGAINNISLSSDPVPQFIVLWSVIYCSVLLIESLSQSYNVYIQFTMATKKKKNLPPNPSSVPETGKSFKSYIDIPRKITESAPATLLLLIIIIRKAKERKKV